MNKLPYLLNFPEDERDKIVSLDCEHAGSHDDKDVLIRAVLLDAWGKVILDEFCMPTEEIIDMRTRVHGIKMDQIRGEQSDKELKSKIDALIKDKKVVGHEVGADLRVLGIEHPWSMERDTAYKYSWTICKALPKLKNLARAKLGVKIQQNLHDPVEDALAALMIYAKEYEFWESTLESDTQKKRKLRFFGNDAFYCKKCNAYCCDEIGFQNHLKKEKHLMNKNNFFSNSRHSNSPQFEKKLRSRLMKTEPF